MTTPSPEDLQRFLGSKAINGPYELGPDSLPHPEVPEGRLTPFTWAESAVYPGVTRECVLYRPAQYDGLAEAALHVFNDGGLYLAETANAHRTLDTLIHRGDIPVSLALFVNPGSPGPGLPLWGGGDNRSVEYDTVDGAYARLLTEELIPHVAKSHRLSNDPAMRAIVGISSGGICAFNAAWERPDVFGKVVSHCGSYVNIRGGDRVPSMVRRAERKALRVFLQTGEHDLDIVFGDWPLANRTLASALAYRGYDHRLVVGESGHGLRHGAAILPETLRWLWRDGGATTHLSDRYLPQLSYRFIRSPSPHRRAWRTHDRQPR